MSKENFDINELSDRDIIKILYKRYAYIPDNRINVSSKIHPNLPRTEYNIQDLTDKLLHTIEQKMRYENKYTIY